MIDNKPKPGSVGAVHFWMHLAVQCICTFTSSYILGYEVQACSQNFQKGGYMDVCMPVCMHNFISTQDWLNS